tara:strand:- start:33 stop:1763 length:1731 start_codon:yes stop_codon:yes gene_type:complete
MKLLKLIWKLLTSNEKFNYFIHIVLSLINTFFETVLVALVIPLTQIIMKKEVSIFFLDNFNYLDSLPYKDQVFVAISLLVAIYLVKNVFYAFFLWWQHNYIAKFETRIVKKLFSTYILQPYPFHLAKSSGVLINKINFEVGSFNSTLRAICSISSEVLVLIALSTCLLIYEPQGTLIVICFSLLIFLISTYFLKKKVRIWGGKRFIHQGLANRELIQSFEGIKEIKVMGLEKKIISNFFKNISQAIMWRTKWEITAGFPRIIFETIAVVSFCLLIFAILNFSNSVNLIEITALFLAATFRLMPSLTRITSSYTTFQNQHAPISSIIKDLNLETIELENDKNIIDLKFHESIEIKDLNFMHENTEKLAIDNLNFKIKKGDIIGIIGTSGSGKTTLADIIIGLLKANKGKILVDNIKIDSKNLKNWQKKIGYVPQTIFLSDETIRGNIAYGVDESLINEKRIKQCVQMANLEKFVSELPVGLDTIIGEKGIRISGGQRQRLAVARTLYHDTDILIFDEATSALDPKNESEIISNILSLKGNKTIIIIAHKFSLIKDCDNIIVLDDGKLIKQGKYNDIF